MQKEIRKRCRIRRIPVHLHVHDILVLCRYLYIVARFRLSVVHRVLLHAHERGIGIRLGITVSGAEGFEMLLIFLQLLLVFLQFLCHFFLCLGRLLFSLGLSGQLPVLLVQFLYLLGKQLAVYSLWHGLCIRDVVLCYAFLYLREYVLYLLLKLRLVLLNGLLPDKGIFVCYTLYLRAIDVLFLKGYLTHVNEESHHLREKFVDGILHVFAAEAVDGTERGSLATAEPHVVNVVLQGILYLAA